MFRFIRYPLALAALLPALLGATTAASASTLLLDDFAAPTPVVNLMAPSQNFVTSQPGIYAGVAGQNRAAYYYPYFPNPAAGAGNTATLGNGALTVAAAPGTIGEVGLGYGAYGAPASNLQSNGPFLHLDLSGYDALRVSFSSLAKPINLIISFYTSKPLAAPGATYYLDGEVTLNPAAGGGPVSGNILFKGADANMPPGLFNFAQVDGLAFIVDRAAVPDGNGYQLTNLSFTQAVPEPASAALLGAGVLFVWLRSGRRAQRGVL
jgi:hypothetical protein